MTRYLVYLRRWLALTFDRIGARLRNNFYLYAAVIFTLVAIGDALTVNYIVGLRHKSFDTMVKHRLHVAEPAADIVIVDIDERSLAAMSSEYGRWPWPRQVFGEFIEGISAQKPKAIVFDILFSDADLYNPDSDAYFNEAIAATKNTWFPMIRLAPEADRESRLKVADLPAATRSETSLPDATIAVILPYFAAIQKSGRIGFNNILPDSDGITRSYPIRHHAAGYSLPSLPLAVALNEDPRRSPPDQILLNWRGKPFTYPHISFSDLAADLRREHRQRPATELTDKIVIIGSTAPSLYDIKATAVDRIFPGVEILATAIDNLRTGDWLRVPQIPFVYLSITLLILWLTAWGFYRHGAEGRLDRFYGLSQFALIAIAFAALNLWNLYINLTGPVMFCFLYYSISRYYAFATARALDESLAVRVQGSGNSARGSLLLLRFDLPTREDRLIERLSATLLAACKESPSAEWIAGRQRGIWRLFENTLVLYWEAEAGDDERWEAIREEAQTISAGLERTLASPPFDVGLPYARLTVQHAEGGVGCGKSRDWRILLGAALISTRKEA